MSIRLEIVQAFDVMGNQIARAFEDTEDKDLDEKELIACRIDNEINKTKHHILGLLVRIRRFMCPICGKALNTHGGCPDLDCPFVAPTDNETMEFLQDAVAIAVEADGDMRDRLYGLQARIAAKKKGEVTDDRS